MRVLVLDDDVVYRRLLGDVLNEVGLTACFAHSLEDARFHLRDHEHALVMTELLLTDGFITVADLRRGSTVEVVVVSRYAPVEELTAGAAQVLPKPYAIDQLIELITSMTGASSADHRAGRHG